MLLGTVITNETMTAKNWHSSFATTYLKGY